MQLTLPDRRLAYQQRRAAPDKTNLPGVLFLGGFASDMTGTKALYLDDLCAKAGYGFTRFDYRGHGASSDRFEDGCIGDWADDALQVLDKLTQGPQLLVGSSMGGWIALLLLRARPERIAGFLGLAAAPDFTQDMVIPLLTPQMKEELAEGGFTHEPQVREGEEKGALITRRLLEDGAKNLVLRETIPYRGPVRLLQGMKDGSVPWRHALKILDTLASDDARLHLLKDADHRLSRPQDLALIGEMVEDLLKAKEN